MVNDKGATVHDVDDTEKNNEDTKDNGDEVADDADIVCKNIKSSYERKGSLNKHIISVHEANVTVINAPRSFRVK